MTKFNQILVITITICTVGMLGCNRQSEYHKMVGRELASGAVYDSLFLGLKFGMTSKEFYAHCWKLNKDGLVKQGPQNMTVEYKIKELEHAATMNFYPDFYQDKIYEMPVTFAYESWAPWNKSLFADSLQLDVVKLYEKWYGNGFIKIENSEKGPAYVKVDGNRRISIFKSNNDREVNVLYTDLKIDEQLQAEKASATHLE